jgi:hypothetical protein
MTTETALAEAAQAKVFARAFELGLTRLLSVVATRQELREGLEDLRSELQREIDRSRSEMRFLFLVFGGVVTGLLSAILAIVA